MYIAAKVGQASWPVVAAKRLIGPPTGQEACPTEMRRRIYEMANLGNTDRL